MNAEDLVRGELRRLLLSYPLFPPRDTGTFKPLDIVVLDPKADAGMALVHAGVNLLDTPVGASLREKFERRTVPRSERPRYPFRERAHELAAYANVVPLRIVAADGARQNVSLADLVLTDETVTTLQRSATEIEDCITNAEAFNYLVTSTSLRQHIPATRNTRLKFGVLTEVREAKLCAQAASVSGAHAAVAVGVPDGGGARASAHVTNAQNLVHLHEGVVGVRMLCFLVSFEGDRYRVSGAIPVVHGEESRFVDDIRWVNAGINKLLHVVRRRRGYQAMLVNRANATDLSLTDDQRNYISRRFMNYMGDTDELPEDDLQGLAGTDIWNAQCGRITAFSGFNFA